MTRNTAKRAASEIAREIIEAARNSGGDPIAWVTGNAMMPPLRWFDAAERIWQLPGNSFDAWESMTERLEELLSEANVALESPEYDNSLYAVDLSRWQYTESDGDTLQSEWMEV